jgi:hypothetical protein
MSIRPLLPHKEGERGIPPKPFPVNNSSVDEQPLSDPFAKPDYGSLLRRSLDLLDRKYDYTPEGRCEANKLALELELMKPAPAKPARDYFGRIVDLVGRCREGEARNAGGGSEPSSVPAEAFLNYYGHQTRRSARLWHSHSRLCASQTRPPHDPNRRPHLIRKLVARHPSRPQSPRRSGLAHLRRATLPIL